MSSQADPSRKVPAFLAGGGSAGELARSVDWANTPLGAVEGWPESLKSAVGIILHSRHPMFLWWGPELVQLYNDAYLPSFRGDKHPAAMGQRGRDCWQEIWPIIWPQIDDVMSRGKASWNEDQLVSIHRNGKLEEVYWTYGYSPVYAEDGSVGGTLVVCTETTSRVLAERRQATLRKLIDRTALAENASALVERAHEVLVQANTDIPFSLLYEPGPQIGALRLLTWTGLNDPALFAVDEQVRSYLSNVEHIGGSVEKLTFAPPETAEISLPGGPWQEPCRELVIAPLRSTGPQGTTGFLVCGISPRLSFDRDYHDFVAQIAEHLSLAHTRVEAFRMRMAAEHERRNLLLQAPVATALLTGPDHVFELANPLYCQLVGRSDLIGKSYRDAFPELGSSGLFEVLDSVYLTGKPFVTDEYPAALDRRGDGKLEECFFRFNLEPMRTTTGLVYGMMAVAVDITEQVRARHILEKAHGEHEQLLVELEAANRAKDEFLAMLGHELRNPLAPIVTALHLMQLRQDTKTAKEQAIIQRQVTHLVRLVDDLLDVSRITRGKVVLRKELVEISDIVSKAVEMASMLLEKRQHTLTIEVPRRGLCVDGDPVRLAQVVSNLLTNAAHYTERCGQIRLSAYRDESNVVIKVRDTGSGISPELLPHIFDLFVQGKRTFDRAEGGLGIGLTLVKNLVGLHGGSVAAHSEGLGKGTEFVVQLPAIAGSIKTPVPPAHAPNTGTLRALDSSKRILVVDDNSDAAELLAAVLEVAGHEVQIAYDPIVALSTAQTFKPEIAVLDIGLPVMDGYELAVLLRESAETMHCRLIALTGYGQDHDRQRSQAAGFERHLVKPIDAQELLRIVARAAPT